MGSTQGLDECGGGLEVQPGSLPTGSLWLTPASTGNRSVCVIATDLQMFSSQCCIGVVSPGTVVHPHVPVSVLSTAPACTVSASIGATPSASDGLALSSDTVQMVLSKSVLQVGGVNISNPPLPSWLTLSQFTKLSNGTTV